MWLGNVPSSLDLTERTFLGALFPFFGIMMNPTTQFLNAFQTAFSGKNLLKCTLSKPSAQAPEGLKNVYLRPVELKKGVFIAFNFRYKTRDEVKNYTPDEALAQLKQLLGTAFLNADLLTPERDYSLQFDKKGEAQYTEKKPSLSQAQDLPFTHDRNKNRLLDPSAPWLHLLGITNAKGEVLAAHQDKWRQINKYLETIESLLRDQPLASGASIADMGSGKGYLTFALYDFLENHLGLQPQITGIELRPALVDFCNHAAQKVGFQNLKFVAQDIANYQPERLDMLIDMPVIRLQISRWPSVFSKKLGLSLWRPVATNKFAAK